MTTADPTSTRLASTVALITGANKGIGYEVARLLGLQGATVLVGARDDRRGKAAVETLRGFGVAAQHVPLDVTNQQTIDDAARSIDAEHGQLDILVNNAAIADSASDHSTAGSDAVWGPPSSTSVAAMRAVYEANVFGVVAVTNALLPLLHKSAAGRIVNVSSSLGSIAATLNPTTMQGQVLMTHPYPSSKAALNMVTALYAKELRDTPIKVNAANPGYCATDLNDHQGYRTAEQGAEPIVHLATLGPDGPTGSFYGDRTEPGTPERPYDTIPW